MEILRLNGHTSAVLSAAFSPEGRRIVTASEDNTIRMWDVQSGVELLQLIGHTREVNAAAFSPDGLRIVTASDDHTARMWDAQWLVTVRGEPLIRFVCSNKLVGDTQVFTRQDIADPILSSLERKNPCARYGYDRTKERISK